jgi:hypothetical protein
MNRLTVTRAALLLLLIGTIALGEDKTPHTYLKGTITGWDTRIDIRYSGNNGQRTKRRTRVYELKTPDLIYEIDDCGAFQAGQFTAGQEVEYRVSDAEKRIYILHDNGKEYRCKMEGARTPGSDKPDAPSTTH